MNCCAPATIYIVFPLYCCESPTDDLKCMGGWCRLYANTMLFFIRDLSRLGSGVRPDPDPLQVPEGWLYFIYCCVLLPNCSPEEVLPFTFITWTCYFSHLKNFLMFSLFDLFLPTMGIIRLFNFAILMAKN